jgi:dihydrolipoamide dehydrogenase
MRLLFHSLIFTSLVTSASSFVPARPLLPRGSSLEASKCGNFDFDVAIIGCGVGGHGAALHSRAQELSTAVFAGGDVGGTCVNRGCVPSKALLAASGRVREMRNAEHLASFGITVQGDVTYDRAGIAAHAKNLANKVKSNLEGSLTGLGVEVIEGRGVLTSKAHEIKDDKTGKIYTAKVRFSCGVSH